LNRKKKLVCARVFFWGKKKRKMMQAKSFQCTEFCPDLLIYGLPRGECKRGGPTCKFAHSDEEIQPKEFFTVYKVHIVLVLVLILLLWQTEECPHFRSGCGKEKRCSYLHDEIVGYIEDDQKKQLMVLVDLDLGTMRLCELLVNNHSKWRQRLLALPIFVSLETTTNEFKTKLCVNWHKNTLGRCIKGYACTDSHDEVTLQSKGEDKARMLLLRHRLSLCWKEIPGKAWVLMAIPDKFKHMLNTPPKVAAAPRFQPATADPAPSVPVYSAKTRVIWKPPVAAVALPPAAPGTIPHSTPRGHKRPYPFDHPILPSKRPSVFTLVAKPRSVVADNKDATTTASESLDATLTKLRQLEEQEQPQQPATGEAPFVVPDEEEEDGVKIVL